MLAPPPRAGSTPLQRAQWTRWRHMGSRCAQLAPQQIRGGARERADRRRRAAPVNAPLEEISVYASRYSIEGRAVAEPRELSSSDIERRARQP